MGHCVGWMELHKLCTLVFISILYLTNDNYYCYNEHYMLLMYQFIIMLSPIYSHDIVQSRKPWPRLDRFVIFFINLKKIHQ